MIINYKKGNNPIPPDGTPVLLDFFAEWCGPCKMTTKYLEEFSEKHPDLLICKINVDEYENLANSWNIQSLPALIYTTLEDGGHSEIWRHVGLITVKQLEEKVYGSKE